MSESKWRESTKNRIGLILSIFIAALATLFIVESAWLHQRELYDEAASNSAYYAENAKNDVAVKCGSPASQAHEKCAQEIKDAARKEQRDEYDLYAQRAVAVWTAIMGGMAVLGVSLSAVGIYLIWATFRETRTQAKIAQDNLLSYQHAERGFAIIHSAVVKKLFSATEESFIHIVVENTGRSPIRVTRVAGGWRTDLREWSWPPENQFQDIQSRYCRPEFRTEGIGTKIHQGLPTTFVVIGSVWYETLGMKDREAPFAFSVHTSTGRKTAICERIDTLAIMPPAT